MRHELPVKIAECPPWASAARAAYMRGDTMKSIRVLAGNANPSRLYFWIDRVVDADGTVTQAPVARRINSRIIRARQGSNAAQVRRLALLRRLWSAAERQMSSIEERFAVLQPGEAVGEADAKSLGFVARLVKELAALDDTDKGSNSKGGDRDGQATEHADSATDAAAMAELRQQVARQLAGLDTGATS